MIRCALRANMNTVKRMAESLKTSAPPGLTI
nr:MAG TPA: hypothetical protein [Caudoviricetes sp.]DAI64734.1 MAG TPA: hypothetical protein [Caudoviricetes sp.]